MSFLAKCLGSPPAAVCHAAHLLVSIGALLPPSILHKPARKGRKGGAVTRQRDGEQQLQLTDGEN